MCDNINDFSLITAVFLNMRYCAHGNYMSQSVQSLLIPQFFWIFYAVFRLMSLYLLCVLIYQNTRLQMHKKFECKT
jgi:hypothetical protein